MALQTPPGCFFVQNRFNGHVLQIESETSNVSLRSKSDNASGDQLWYKDGNFIKSKHNNLALTMNPGMAVTGAKLYVACCQWSPYQKWITKQKCRIANHMEQCLVLQTDDSSNVRVKLEHWNDDPKQLWDFVPVGKKTTSEERISLLSTTTEI